MECKYCGKETTTEVCGECLAFIHKQFLSTDFFAMPFCAHLDFTDIVINPVREIVDFKCLKCEKTISIPQKELIFNRYKNEITVKDPNKKSRVGVSVKSLIFVSKIWTYALLWGCILITILCIISAIWGPHPIDSMTN